MEASGARGRIIQPSFCRAEAVKQITIIGGGLAGLALGIALRKKDVPATVIEAGRYPRHRVCGEFISGTGLAVFRALKLDELVRDVTQLANDSAFFTAHKKFASRPLPHRAITVSRFHLDAALAENFRHLGGDLHEDERWRGQTVDEGVVCAMGRRAQPVENGWRWFGLKVHARQVELTAHLEMHVARDSYVGLCRLASGEVNVCGLFRRKTDAAPRGDSMNWLRGERESILFRRLERAEFDPESFCAVAGLSLRPQIINWSECRIGDALTMIPPITGNGMSMAFESAYLAADPLAAYARGESGWKETTARIADSLSRRFTRRLSWAGLFHRVLFSRFSPLGLRVLFNSEFGWRTAFAATR
jgi:flavin-dependent dehydrogenase